MQERADAVNMAMDDIRDIENRFGMTREAVEAIRDRLVELSLQRDLFPLEEFPPPGDDDESSSFMYRLAQDDDDRYALYAQSSRGHVETPAHNHTTWAVVVGFEGQEHNRFYERSDEGVTQVDDHMVEAGTGVAMLPDDLHSIHIDGPALNFHCYGLALERLDEREYYSDRDGTWKIFSSVSGIREAGWAHDLLMSPEISAATLVEWLLDGDEVAVLDAREQGVFFDSHLFHAACLPLSTLELQLPTLVPRQTTRVVWCDGGPASTHPELAAHASVRATDLGWTDCHVLAGGTAAWASAGGELYAGVNVPSKAFGEHVEHTYDTPRISASELKSMLDAGTNLTVLDSRPMGEFRRMSIPSGIDCPGAELVHRVKQVVTDPDTLVVVNCAGRTRSIIGAQSLINAGLENRVVALENGTMGWELAGFEVARGHETHAADPDHETQRWSTAAVAPVAERFGVESISIDELDRWRADPSRTTYVLDVRTPEEFADGHVPGSVSAPGGQLVQATDEYVATRGARLVLIDDNGVRATMTASWLRQLGWNDAVVLTGGVDAAAELERGPVPRRPVPVVSVVKAAELADRLRSDSVTVLDLGTSLKHRDRGHVPGSWWGVRSRMDEARAVIGEVDELVITSSDGQLAKLAVAEAAVVWPHASVAALAGGTRGWRHAGCEMELGLERPTTTNDDVWYKPYDHDDTVVEQHMRDYLTWEIALVEQLDRDDTVSFPRFPVAAARPTDAAD